MNDIGRPDNFLLARLRGEDFALLAPHLNRADLPKGYEMVVPGEPQHHCWFPQSGLVSVVAVTDEGAQAEVGVIGREGMVSTSIVHGVPQNSLRAFVQIAGVGLRMPAERLRAAMAASPVLERVMLAYAHTFLVQVAHTALAYATRTIEERLARWLLMCLDRIDGPDVALTHEQLSLMLGVRRAGVTVAINALEASGVVAARRGLISVLDRRALERIANDCYGIPEADYAEVMLATAA